jgi:RimJ/RimL family protein N-acetyltransferase
MNGMTTASKPTPFSQQAVLRDGTPILIRVVSPEDRQRIVAAFGKLEPDSIYTRFFSMKKELSAAELDRVTTTDFEHYLALAASIGSGAGETLIGGASYTVLRSTDGARAAEVAFTIEEDYQRQGLASTLLGLLAGIAREHGITRLEAEVLEGNASMLSVFEHSGLPMVTTRAHGVIHVAMDLRNPGEQR